jgi:hypothetical protein
MSTVVPVFFTRDCDVAARLGDKTVNLAKAESCGKMAQKCVPARTSLDMPAPVSATDTRTYGQKVLGEGRAAITRSFARRMPSIIFMSS